jgi:hypothetical protein
MNTTRDSTSIKLSMIKRSTSDDFPIRLRDFCQLFRFYASVILVIVGKYSLAILVDELHTMYVHDFMTIYLGMIGSMLSIKVFSSTKIRRNSSNEYLITSNWNVNLPTSFWTFSCLVSFVVALLLFNFFCDEVLRSLVHDFHVDLPLNLVDLSRPLCKCKLTLFSFR